MSSDADAYIEKMVDRAVQRRLATDAAYRNAENAEEQSEREDEIARQEWERITGESLRGGGAVKVDHEQQTCADVAAAAMKLLPERPVYVRIVSGPDAGAVYPVTHIAGDAARLVLVVRGANA